MTELKPCPFCGGQPVITGRQINCGSEHCVMTSVVVKADSLKFATECWNTRYDAASTRTQGADNFDTWVIGEYGTVIQSAETLRLMEAAYRAGSTQGADDRCPYCDNTGDVHSIDGEWRGECTECKRADDAKPVAWRFQWRNKGEVDWQDNWQTQVCKPVFSEHEPYDYRIEPLFATRDAAPRTEAQDVRLAKFLNGAAGDGYMFDGVDAGELFLELFPDYFNAAASAPRDK